MNHFPGMQRVKINVDHFKKLNYEMVENTIKQQTILELKNLNFAVIAHDSGHDGFSDV